MKTTHLIAALVGIVTVYILATDASAMYNPSAGTFMQRDPGAGTATRAGGAGPAVGGGFIPRDQYADGMNLYQYARSSPCQFSDPMGTKCCVTKVVFKHRDSAQLIRRNKPDGKPLVVPNNNGNPAIEWRIQLRVDIRAYVTEDSNPKDCVMSQLKRNGWAMVLTNDTSTPSGIRHEGPLWDVDGPPEWDRVTYGDNWAEWNDEPGIDFLTDPMQALNGGPPQRFLFHDTVSFRTAIYDKKFERIGGLTQWVGYWDYKLRARLLTDGVTVQNSLIWADRSRITLDEYDFAPTTEEEIK